MSIIPMLRPFVIQGAFIPVLPTCYQTCIDAPIPYIIGTPKLEQEYKIRVKKIVVINMDDNKIFMPADFDPLSFMPHKSKLFYKLRPFHEKLRKEIPREKKWIRPFKSSPEEIALMKSMLKELNNYIGDLIKLFAEKVRPFWPEFTYLSFNDKAKMKALIAELPKRSQTFFQHFCTTQLFVSYSELLFQVFELKQKEAIEMNQLLSEVETLLKKKIEENQSPPTTPHTKESKITIIAKWSDNSPSN